MEHSECDDGTSKSRSGDDRSQISEHPRDNPTLCGEKSTRLVSAKEAIKIADAQGTRVKLVASLQDVAGIYRGLLSTDVTLNRWSSLLGWNKLSLEEKKKHYTELASHEANLFLYRHDRLSLTKLSDHLFGTNQCTNLWTIIYSKRT